MAVPAAMPRNHLDTEGQSTMATKDAKQRHGANDAAAPPVTRLNVRINPEAHRRLMIHCVMAGKAPGAFLERLIEDHCRTWKVQENSHGRVKADDRPDLAAGVSVPMSNVA
jgi:hypothetical protein